MRILRAADHKRMPWKNGGGETTEIAIFPETARLSDFDWRVSMARVDGDGPFSMFSGIDRTLAILEGAGIDLGVEGYGPTRLTIDTEPHTFPADVATSATLIGGTVVDFNVMSRRGRVAHSVERFHGDHNSPAGAVRLAFCTGGTLTIKTGSATEMLRPRDALLLDDHEAATLSPGGSGIFYLVTFRIL
jgi:uncharacterized protein